MRGGERGRRRRERGVARRGRKGERKDLWGKAEKAPR
jgi:hypothetical protein